MSRLRKLLGFASLVALVLIGCASQEEFEAYQQESEPATSSNEAALTQTFSYGACVGTLSLNTLYGDGTGMVGTLKLGSGCGNGSALITASDSYNVSYVLSQVTRTGGANQTLSTSNAFSLPHSASCKLCDLATNACQTSSIYASESAASGGYVYEGKATCTCKDGSQKITTGTATGPKHSHNKCTEAKRAAASQCATSCKNNGGVSSAVHSSSPCKVKKK